MSDSAALLRRPVLARPDLVVVETAPGMRFPFADLSTARLATAANIAVGDTFAVEALLLKGRRRGARRLAAARQFAMALVHMVAGRSQEDVARAFKRNRTTASHHMEMVEALNDVPEFEAMWNLLEQRFRLVAELMALPSGRTSWLEALTGIDQALDDGTLEGDAVDQARYIRSVFWEDRIA